MSYSSFYNVSRTEARGEMMMSRPSSERIIYNFILFIVGFIILLMFYVLLFK